MCNRDCFNCPYEDCIEEGMTYQEILDIEGRDRGQAATRTEKQTRKNERSKAYYVTHKEQYHENYLKHRDERMAYYYDYYEKNKEVVKARKKRYYEKNKEKVSAWKKKYYEKNKETILAKMKERRHKNAEISV